MADGDIVIVVNGVSFVEDSSERTIPAAILVSPSVAAQYCSGRVVKIHPDNVQHWRDAGYLPTLDPWALPAGLEWRPDPDNPAGWMVCSIDGSGIDFAVAASLLPILERRNATDPPNASGRISGGPPAQSIPRVRITCPDCHGTRVYVGLGFFPAEPCRTCAGTGKVATAPTVTPDWFIPKSVPEDPWALPPEAVAAGLRWFKDGADADYPWAIERDVMGPMRVYLHEDVGALFGPAGDLDPNLVAQLFELIKRRNVAEP